MDSRVDAAPRAGAARALHAVALPMASFVLATSAHAQASPCDDYRAVLEARFEATGVRGYSLELVPASAPVPPGAKVIANCEGGARKFIYRRWAAASASSAAASALRAASAVPAAVDATARQLPTGAQGTRMPTPAPASAVAAMPVARASQARAATADTLAKPATPLTARASEPASVRPTERVAEGTVVAKPAAAAPVRAAASTAATADQRASAFASAHWPWLGGLAALVGGLWLWRIRFSGYDRDGLPRGPRL